MLAEKPVLDADGRPLKLIWNYNRAELIADGVVHVLGLTLGLAGAITLVVLGAWFAKGLEIASLAIYATGLLLVLGISAAYNMWPVSRTKWILRRFDHAAIYILIAATYTPFLTQLHQTSVSLPLLIGIWTIALIGASLKFLAPGRFDGLSIVLYLAMGWSGLLAYGPVSNALSSSTLWLIAAGGLCYSGGVVFHLWHSLRFQNAVWHAFVLVACALHYGAVLDAVLLTS